MAQTGEYQAGYVPRFGSQGSRQYPADKRADWGWIFAQKRLDAIWKGCLPDEAQALF